MRLYFPAYVLIYLLATISAGYFTQKKPKHTGIVLLIVFLLPFLNFSSFNTFEAYSKDMPHYPETALYKIGTALSEFSDREILLVTSYGGAIPYYSKLRHVDTYGLTTPSIAVNGIAPSEYIESISPDIILAYNSIAKAPKNDTHFLPFERPFVEYALANNYVVLSGIKFLPNYYFIPLVNPNFENIENLRELLAKVG